MPVRDQFERCTDPSLNAMHAGLADVIGRWLKREGDSSTSIDNLLFFSSRGANRALRMHGRTKHRFCCPGL